MEYKYLDRTDEDIKNEMLNSTDDKVSKIAGTFLNDSFGASAIKLAEVYMELDYLNQKRDINNLTGTELDMYIEQKAGKQVVRRKATYAKGYIEVTGDNGTVIKEGSILSINDINYKTLEDGTIAEGLVVVEIESLVSGNIGNASVDNSVIFINSINGINSVKLKTDVTGGYEEESDESLIKRYLDYIQKPPTSGNIYHYIHWAKQIEGVGDVKVVPLWNGKNTVKIIITDNNMETASEDLIKKVQEHIDPNSSGLGEGEAPIGAHCTVVSATSKDITVSVTLELDIGYNLEDVEEEVFNNINDYLRKLNFSDSEVSYAKVGAAILFTQGIKDYKELKLNNSKENIDLTDEETAVLKDVILNE